jgi:hypothetical protein
MSATTQDPGPFVATTGNPENGNWDEFSAYLKAIQGMSVEALTQACGLYAKKFARTILESSQENPRPDPRDPPDLAHFKRLYARLTELKTGVRFDEDGLYFRV